MICHSESSEDLFEYEANLRAMKVKNDDRICRTSAREGSRRTASTQLLVVLLFCCLGAVTGSAYAQIKIPPTGIINTVAGNGTAGYSGHGGAATGAELFDPTGAAVDKAGNIYIADISNNRVRKVTASTGIISTVAENGVQG